VILEYNTSSRPARPTLPARSPRSWIRARDGVFHFFRVIPVNSLRQAVIRSRVGLGFFVNGELLFALSKALGG